MSLPGLYGSMSTSALLERFLIICTPCWDLRLTAKERLCLVDWLRTGRPSTCREESLTRAKLSQGQLFLGRMRKRSEMLVVR